MGDACASCARLAWTDPASAPPDQNPARSRIKISGASQPGRTGVRASGRFNPAATSAIDPATSGIFVRVLDRDGVLSEWNAPPGLAGSGCGSRDGWSMSRSRGAVSWHYQNATGALPSAGCAAGSAAGLRSLTLAHGPTEVAYELRVQSATLSRPLAQPVRFLQLDLVLGAQPGGGVGSAAGDAGLCAESVLRLSGPGSACRVSGRSGAIQSVQCSSAP